MNDKRFTFVIIPIIIIIIISITKYIRNKIYRPKYENGVQKPGRLAGFITKLFMFIDAILLGMLVLGIVMKESDMAIVSGGLGLFTLVIILFLKHAYNISYQENTEYLILKFGSKEYKVFYEDIIDWKPSFNEISILDKSSLDKKYIRINIAIFKPEILLRKIADMSFDGKFYSSDKKYLQEPNRQAEIVYYLINNNYGYLIKDYINQTEDEFLNKY